MASVLTREVLKIFWTTKQSSTSLNIVYQQDEAAGMLVYGFWNQLYANCTFPLHLWPAKSAKRQYIYQYDNCLVMEWTLCIIDWPEPHLWHAILENTMRHICRNGASVVWCGHEGAYNEPPKLFVPESQDGIYAAYTSQHGMMLNTTLDGPYCELSNMELIKLRKILASSD